MTYVALCAVGAEKILGNEIKHLGYSLLDRQSPGRVTFTGDMDAMYRANYCLRTSDRVYIQLAEYKAYNFDELYDGCYKINWQDYLKKTARVIVDKVRVHGSRLNSEHSIQSMILKSIYTKLGDVWHMGSMPETGESIDVRVYLDKNVATILLDTSGEALHKRGYRTDGGIAPLRETTAAVMLQELMWRRKTPLHDPFCGSGTIAIEAALYAHNIAPGLGRRFAYENLVIYDKDRALEIKKEEASKIRTDVECRITGSDIDPAAVERSRLNAEHACVMAGRALQLIGSDLRIERPDFIQSDYKDIRAPYETGLLLCNPPYGERLLDQAEAEDLYGEMKSLFVDFENWQMGVITSQKKFQECICRKASAIKTLKAGNLDTSLYIYR